MGRLVICGGGNAAHVLVALAARSGWEVNVFAPFGDEAHRLRVASAAEGVTARFAGGPDVTGRLQAISDDPARVIPGADLVLLALPAFAHGPTLRAIAPHLDQGVALGALPARGGFDYQARTLLAKWGQPGRLFGLQTLPWACRIIAYGREVAVLGVKATVHAAFDPPDEADDLISQLGDLLRVPVRPVGSFLALTLANTGQILHPGGMYGLCRGREAATFAADEIPPFYHGVDEATAGVLQAMSDDIQRVAARLQAQLPSFDASDVVPLHDWLLAAYPEAIEDGTSLRTALVSNHAYQGLRLPVRPQAPLGPRLFVGPTARGAYQIDYEARYLTEDVPFGLVVVRGIAQLAAVPTPTLDEVIRWAEQRIGRRYLIDQGELSLSQKLSLSQPRLVLGGPDLEGTRAPQIYGIDSLDALGAAESFPARE